MSCDPDNVTVVVVAVCNLSLLVTLILTIVFAANNQQWVGSDCRLLFATFVLCLWSWCWWAMRRMPRKARRLEEYTEISQSPES
ncbi:hypothetical protein V8E51_017532 [Hyaloscypha variabilis]